MKRLIYLLIILITSCSQPVQYIQMGLAPRFGFQVPYNFIRKPVNSITPKNIVLNDIRFPESKYLNKLEVLNNTDYLQYNKKTRIIAPGMYKTWEEAGINDKRYNRFLLVPGDYSPMGNFTPKRSGKTIIVRYYNASETLPYNPVHPCKQINQVILSGFRFEYVSGWVLHGLTFKSSSNNRIYESDNNIIDYCYFEDSKQYGIRIVNSSFNWIQNCVFKQIDLTKNRDGGCIGISATRLSESRSNKIINNEIVNFNDGLGTPRESSQDTTAGSMTGSVPGTIFENNDIYITPEMYIFKSDGVYSCSENCVDLKNGTKSLLLVDKIQIITNRMWGTRASDNTCVSGSNGTALVAHRNASNIIIRDNIVFDVPIVFTVSAHDKKFSSESIENITVTNNLMLNLGVTNAFPYTSSGLLLGTGVNASNNTVINALRPYYIANSKVENTFSCNAFSRSETDQFKEFSFYKSRWIKPEKVIVKGISTKSCSLDDWN